MKPWAKDSAPWRANKKGEKIMKNGTKILIGCLAGVLFLALIAVVRTVDVAAIGPEGTSVGLSKLNQSVHEMTGVNFFLYDLTQYLGYFSLLLGACFAFLGLKQLVQGRTLKSVDFQIWALGALYVAIGVLYVLFEKFIVNYRPVIMPGEEHVEASFPSSHTMLFSVILGSTAMMIGQYVKNRTARKILQAACWLLAAAGVAVRLLSGVHWFTDIVGGILISAALLFLFSAVLPSSRASRRRRRY